MQHARGFRAHPTIPAPSPYTTFMQNDVYGGAFLNLLYPSTIAQTSACTAYKPTTIGLVDD